MLRPATYPDKNNHNIYNDFVSGLGLVYDYAQPEFPMRCIRNNREHNKKLNNGPFVSHAHPRTKRNNETNALAPVYCVIDGPQPPGHTRDGAPIYQNLQNETIASSPNLVMSSNVSTASMKKHFYHEIDDSVLVCSTGKQQKLTRCIIL